MRTNEPDTTAWATRPTGASRRVALPVAAQGARVRAPVRLLRGREPGPIERVPAGSHRRGRKPGVRGHPPRAGRATTHASGPTDVGHDTKTGLEPPTGLGARNPLDRPAGSPNKRAGHKRGGRRRTPTRLVGLTGVHLVVEITRLMAFATPSTTGTTTLTSPASTNNSGIRLPSWSLA